eukprot:COSAG03_NODE_3954_length_1745_cov_1.148846_2_plen_28_part_01
MSQATVVASSAYRWILQRMVADHLGEPS